MSRKLQQPGGGQYPRLLTATSFSAPGTEVKLGVIHDADQSRPHHHVDGSLMRLVWACHVIDPITFLRNHEVIGVLGAIINSAYVCHVAVGGDTNAFGHGA